MTDYSDDDDACSLCGLRFTPSRYLSLRHPNLFGTEDLICSWCQSKQEKEAERAVKAVLKARHA